MLKQLWNDEAGALLSAEVVLLGTILVIGIIAGLTSLRDAVVTELADVGGALATLDQSYFYGGTQAHHVITYGSFFNDNHDFCDQLADLNNEGNSKCLVLCGNTVGECGHGGPQ